MPNLSFRVSFSEVAPIRRALNEMAEEMGYVARAGYDSGGGLLAAIVGGEVALVLLPDEQRAWAIEYLRGESKRLAGSSVIRDISLAEALEAIANSLAEALARERE